MLQNQHMTNYLKRERERERENIRQPCACVRACVYMCVRACVRECMCMRACVRVYACHNLSKSAGESLCLADQTCLTWSCPWRGPGAAREIPGGEGRERLYRPATPRYTVVPTLHCHHQNHALSPPESPCIKMSRRCTHCWELNSQDGA